ncbi:cytochrome P450 [Sistotremastrum niveocremeum HHB9708]|uniref:Cytochrome P450 n=1 Tax=Sistotremastrum niveocremeum HHB9708 TaxID=1314777 RepID=A0A164PG66_9AGAM|nr:cytochrome P450 [Sistotremastrum niveocremeum HHB9708]
MFALEGLLLGFCLVFIASREPVLSLGKAFLVIKKLRGPLPPGPPPGASLATARKHGSRVWEEYGGWARKSGPVIYATYGKTSLLLLSSAKAANDLLNKRSRIYSDRPSTVMFGELIGHDKTVFRSPTSSPRFKIHRRLMAEVVGGSDEREYVKVMEEKRISFLVSLRDDPNKFITHIKANAAAIILQVVYGYTLTNPSTDPLLRQIQEYVTHLSREGTFGKWLVDSYPFLKYTPEWFPGGSFHTFAREQRKRTEDLVQRPMEWVKTQMRSGISATSFVEEKLTHSGEEQAGRKGENMEEIIGYVAAALYVGGADTTVSALMSFFLLMVQYPSVQSRAQAEIDKCIPSHDRIPTLADPASLVYVEAVIKEVLRFAPIGALGLPHKVTEDDWYDGMFIPKGTPVIGNIWAILQDPDVYNDPITFDPTRHLPQHLTGTPPQPNPADYVFGFGRRICPGNQFALTSLFLSISSILALFDIGPPIDELGNTKELEVEYEGGTVAHPRPFECHITPRKHWMPLLENLSFVKDSICPNDQE